MSQVSSEQAVFSGGSVGDLYRATRKREDMAFNVYVCRPLAAFVVYALRTTRVTPNQVTFFSLMLALGAATLLNVVAWPLGLWLGVALYEISYVFDKVDGMLARSRGVQSTTGHLLDFLMDEIKAFIILGAVAIRLWRERNDERFLLLGIVGLVALASGIALTTFIRRPEIAPPAVEGGAAVQKRSLLRRAVGLVESGAKFIVHYPSYILIAAAAGHIEAYLYPYIVVNVLYAKRAFLGVALKFGR